MVNETPIWGSCLFATFNFCFIFSPALSLLMIEIFPSEKPCWSACPRHMYFLTDDLLLIHWRLSFQFLLSLPMQTCLTASHLLISDPLTSSSPPLFKISVLVILFPCRYARAFQILFSTQAAYHNVFSSLYLQEYHMKYLHL